MDFSELLRGRRMVRRYRDRPVDPQLLTTLLDRARRGPSAGNTQAVHFVVVQDGERRAEVARLAGEERYVQLGFEAWLSSAPVLVLLTVRPEEYHQRYREDDKAADSHNWPVPYWHVDAGAALMLLLLAAVEAGLGAGFLGAHRLAGIGALLSLPEDVEIIGLITLGYAAPDRGSASRRRGRRPLSEVVHWEHW